MDREHDGLPEPDDDIRDSDHPVEEVRPRCRLARQHGLRHLDVAAGAEGAARAADDYDADRLVGAGELQGAAELLERLHAQRIELVRPVEPDRGDTVVRPVVDVLVRGRLRAC